VVVDREPGRRHIRLADHHGSVVGVDEAGPVRERLRDAVVADHGGELVMVAQTPAGSDGEFAAVPVPGRRSAVDLDGSDGEAFEVEVEAGQVLGGTCADRGYPGQDIGGRVVPHLERVVLDVVAAVTVQREVRIAGARRARRELWSSLAAGRGTGQRHRGRQR
jgi:hypothetical protein